MNRKIILPTVSLVFGILTVMTGLCFIWMYLYYAIIQRMGEGDQSLLFWYLPILFIGIIVGGIGAGLFILGLAKRKKYIKADEND